MNQYKIDESILNLSGPKDAATEVYESVSTPLTSAEEQLVPNVDQTSVKCSCGFDGVCVYFLII